MENNKLDIFIVNHVSEAFEKMKPYETCPDKFEKVIDEATNKEISRKGVCRRGIVSDFSEDAIKHPFKYCPKCTDPFIKRQILNVPKRFDIKFTSEAFYKKEKELLEKDFLLLEGSDFNTKLIAYYLSKKYVEQGMVAIKISTKRYDSKPILEDDDDTYNDFLGLRLADVVIFEDMKDMSDSLYATELNTRMEAVKKIIFINPPKVIKLVDNDNELLSPDIFRYDVDSINIKII